MNPLRVLPVAILSTLTLAQSPTVLTSHPGSDCQIAIQAAIDGRAVAIKPGDPDPVRLQLTLTNLQPITITDIELIVRNPPADPGATPARSSADPTGLTKTIDLTRRIAPQTQFSIEVGLPTAFAALLQIDVSTITFADGTVWRSSPTRTCHVTPNHARLI